MGTSTEIREDGAQLLGGVREDCDAGPMRVWLRRRSEPVLQEAPEPQPLRKADRLSAVVMAPGAAAEAEFRATVGGR